MLTDPDAVVGAATPAEIAADVAAGAVADVTVTVEVQGAASVVADDAAPEATEPPPADTPGLDVMSVSWVPSAIGPEGFARQEPAGERTAVIPNGIVPA